MDIGDCAENRIFQVGLGSVVAVSCFIGDVYPA